MSRLRLHTKHLKQYDLAPKASSRQILNFQLSRRSAQWPSGRAISPTKYLTSQPSETKISTKNALPLDLSLERSSQRDIQIDIDLELKSTPKTYPPPKILNFLFPRTCTSQPLPPITQSWYVTQPLQVLTFRPLGILNLCGPTLNVWGKGGRRPNRKLSILGGWSHRY